MLLLHVTEAPPFPGTTVSIGGRPLQLPDWAYGNGFASYLFRRVSPDEPPIDAGLVGPLGWTDGPHEVAASERLALTGVPIFAESIAPGPEVRWVALRLYRLDCAGGLGPLLTFEVLLLDREEMSSTAQTTTGHAVYFPSDDLGFVIAHERALDDYARGVGDDLLSRLTTSDDGDDLIARGVLLPVLGVHAWSYRVIAAPDGLDARAAALLGDEVLFGPDDQPLELRLRGDRGELSVLTGRCLERWSTRRRITGLPWPGELSRVRVRGFVTGPHGEGLVPTYVVEVIPETSAALDQPPINCDLGDAWERVVDRHG